MSGVPTTLHQGAQTQQREVILPFDILEHVVRWILIDCEPDGNANTTLARICLVNRIWCAAIRSHLLRLINLRSRTNCDIFSSAIRRTPSLGSNVRVLSVDLYPFQWGESSPITLYDLPWILICLSLLYELQLDLKPPVSLLYFKRIESR